VVNLKFALLQVDYTRQVTCSGFVRPILLVYAKGYDEGLRASRHDSYVKRVVILYERWWAKGVWRRKWK